MNGERSGAPCHTYVETLLTDGGEDIDMYMHLLLHVYCVMGILGIATRPFTLKRGFGLQSCPPSSTSTAMKMPVQQPWSLPVGSPLHDW